MFGIRVLNQGGYQLLVPNNVVVEPQQWSATDMGGFDEADVFVTGDFDSLAIMLDWVGNDITIMGDAGLVCWRGYIRDATINYPGGSEGYTLDKMDNRVRVLYTEVGIDGESVRTNTEWAQDAASVDRYGTYERQLSMSESSANAAETMRDGHLRKYGNRQVKSSLGSGSFVRLQLYCRGHYDEFRRRYYTDLSGIVENESRGTFGHVLGWELTSDAIQFENGGEVKDFTGENYISALPADTKVAVTGTASNNANYTISSAARDGESLTSDRIYFETNDNIRSSIYEMELASGAGGLRVIGSDANSGYWSIDAYNAGDWIEVNPNTIVTESAGPDITLITPAEMTLTPETTAEDAGTMTTTMRAIGERVAQQFTLPVAGSWTCDQIQLRVTRVGSPQDSVRVSLYSQVNGLPGGQLDTTLVTGSTIPTGGTALTSFELSNTVTLTFGEFYWFDVQRTGAPDADNYYIVQLDDATTYTAGVCRYFEAGTWSLFSPERAMSFRVLGATETTAQIEAIVEQTGYNVVGTEISDRSNIYTNQYESGDNRAADVLEELVNTGYVAGDRMMVEVTAGNRLRVRRDRALPERAAYNYALMTGELTFETGGQVPPGQLVYGDYVFKLDSSMPRIRYQNPAYIRRCAFNAVTGRYNLSTDIETPFDRVGKVVQG